MIRKTGLILSFITIYVIGCQVRYTRLCGPAKYRRVRADRCEYHLDSGWQPVCGLRNLSSYNSPRSYTDD